MYKRYSSFDGGFEIVVLGDNDDRCRQVERLLTTTEAELNEHLLIDHLPQPGAMSCRGFQFDAELAWFLGFNLDVVFEEARGVIDAIKNEEFADTDTYKRMLANLQDYETEDDISWKIDQFNYGQRVAAELGTLAILEVISVGIVNLDDKEIIDASELPRVSKDSFFERFNVLKAN